MTQTVVAQECHVASLDIHAQKTFTPLCPNELPIPEGDQIAAELNAQADFSCKRIGTKEAHNPQAIWVANNQHPPLSPIKGRNVDVRWPPHSIVGSEGFELIDGLPDVSDYDHYIWQGIELNLHPYGVCYHDIEERISTGLIEYLHYHHITTVIAGGLATDYCVKTSVVQLLKAGFIVIVNLGACRGLAEDSIIKATEEMQQAGAYFVQSAEELANAIE